VGQDFFGGRCSQTTFGLVAFAESWDGPQLIELCRLYLYELYNSVSAASHDERNVIVRLAPDFL
jgi:hypothetical protein